MKKLACRLPSAVSRRVAAWGLVFLAAAMLPASARAQGLPPLPTCAQLWEEASALAGKDAVEKANLAAGAPPSAAAGNWGKAWRQAWDGVWRTQGAALKPGPGRNCCRADWFQAATRGGKLAWENAWRTSGALSGGDKLWTEKYASTFADEWAKEWFIHYPWLCAKAFVNVDVYAIAHADVWTDATANVWLKIASSARALAAARASVWTEVWTKVGAEAWATAGAAAMAAAAAKADTSALAAVSGNCARAQAKACADAAAAAFAAAWAAAGSKAFAEAFASAWAEASARALAVAWYRVTAKAEASAEASALADAYADAWAEAFAGVWRQKLADDGRLPEILNWWRTSGAPMPAIATIEKLLAADYDAAYDWAWKTAWDWSWDHRRDFKQAYDKAKAVAQQDLQRWTYTWVSAWAKSWAYAWTVTWVETYAHMCSRAAAAVCLECPPCPTTTTTTTRPGTVSRPSGFKYTLKGLGVTAGTVFVVVIQNETGEPLVVDFGETVFKPDKPEYQRIISAPNQRVEVPPKQTAQAPVQGYCLDYGKQPPPATTLGSLLTQPVLLAALDPGAAFLAGLEEQGSGAGSVQYLVDENPSAYAPFHSIIQAGNRLAGEGKLHTDLPPDKHKQAVIQRALWTYASRNTPAPHTRDSLLNDIRRQVKESGGTQIEEQIQELVAHLMEDVDAVLRAAGLS